MPGNPVYRAHVVIALLLPFQETAILVPEGKKQIYIITHTFPDQNVRHILSGLLYHSMASQMYGITIGDNEMLLSWKIFYVIVLLLIKPCVLSSEF